MLDGPVHLSSLPHGTTPHSFAHFSINMHSAEQSRPITLPPISSINNDSASSVASSGSDTHHQLSPSPPTNTRIGHSPGHSPTNTSAGLAPTSPIEFTIKPNGLNNVSGTIPGTDGLGPTGDGAVCAGGTNRYDGRKGYEGGGIVGTPHQKPVPGTGPQPHAANVPYATNSNNLSSHSPSSTSTSGPQPVHFAGNLQGFASHHSPVHSTLQQAPPPLPSTSPQGMSSDALSALSAAAVAASSPMSIARLTDSQHVANAGPVNASANAFSHQNQPPSHLSHLHHQMHAPVQHQYSPYPQVGGGATASGGMPPLPHQHQHQHQHQHHHQPMMGVTGMNSHHPHGSLPGAPHLGSHPHSGPHSGTSSPPSGPSSNGGAPNGPSVNSVANGGAPGSSTPAYNTHLNMRARKVCDVCGRSFSNLSMHKSTHYTSLRQHSCQVCGRSFARINDLCRHERSHRSDAAFMCPLYVKPSAHSHNGEPAASGIVTSSGSSPSGAGASGAGGTSTSTPNSTSSTSIKQEDHALFQPSCHQNGGFSRCDTYKNHLKAMHFDYPAGTKKRDRNGTPGSCKGCGKEFADADSWIATHIETGECEGIRRVRALNDMAEGAIPNMYQTSQSQVQAQTQSQPASSSSSHHPSQSVSATPPLHHSHSHPHPHSHPAQANNQAQGPQDLYGSAQGYDKANNYYARAPPTYYEVPM